MLGFFVNLIGDLVFNSERLTMKKALIFAAVGIVSGILSFVSFTAFG